MTTTSARTPAAADGPSSKDMLVTRKVVTQLSTEALDPELFQIPAGFRPATGSFSAFIDYLGLAWNRIDALVPSLFR